MRVAGIDFEIFSPRTVHQPCARIVFGSGSPAAIRNAGQYTAWKRRMSLPIKWIACGKYLFASAPPSEPSAGQRSE